MEASEDTSMQIEVVYAAVTQIIRIPLQVKPGTTLHQAVFLSGILTHCPEIDLGINKVGIFGKPGKPDTLVSEGDRVEIYRPITADPKEIRRQRAVAQKPDNN